MLTIETKVHCCGSKKCLGISWKIKFCLEPLGASFLPRSKILSFSWPTYLGLCPCGHPLGLATFSPCISLPVLNTIKTGPKNSFFTGSCIAAYTSVLGWKTASDSAQKLASKGNRDLGGGFFSLGRAHCSRSPSQRDFLTSKKQAEQKNPWAFRSSFGGQVPGTELHHWATSPPLLYFI